MGRNAQIGERSAKRLLQLKVIAQMIVVLGGARHRRQSVAAEIKQVAVLAVGAQEIEIIGWLAVAGQSHQLARTRPIAKTDMFGDSFVEPAERLGERILSDE